MEQLIEKIVIEGIEFQIIANCKFKLDTQR